MNAEVLVIYSNRFIVRIRWDELHSCGIDSHLLDSGIAVKSCNDDVAGGRGPLFTHDDGISVQNCRVTHAVAVNAKGEEAATPQPVSRHGYVAFLEGSGLLGPTGYHPPEHGYEGDGRWTFCQAHLTRTASPEGDVPFSGERLQVISSCACRGPAKLGTEISIGRDGIAPLRMSANAGKQSGLWLSKGFVVHELQIPLR